MFRLHTLWTSQLKSTKDLANKKRTRAENVHPKWRKTLISRRESGQNGEFEGHYLGRESKYNGDFDVGAFFVPRRTDDVKISRSRRGRGW